MIYYYYYYYIVNIDGKELQLNRRHLLLVPYNDNLDDEEILGHITAERYEDPGQYYDVPENVPPRQPYCDSSPPPYLQDYIRRQTISKRY